MIFIFGPLYSGKRAAALSILGCTAEELPRRAVWDVQDLAAKAAARATTETAARAASEVAAKVGARAAPEAASEAVAKATPEAAPKDQKIEAVCPDSISECLETLAADLARYDVVIATEVGSGIVPANPADRAAREAAGRLNCLLADRAAAVVRVFCGIPVVLRGELP